MRAINSRAHKEVCVIYSIVSVETYKILYRAHFVFSVVVHETIVVLKEFLISICSHCFVHC